MWTCRNCGQQNPDEAKTCAACGEKCVRPPKNAQSERRAARTPAHDAPFIARALDAAAWTILVLGLLGIFIGLFAAIPWKAAVLVAIAVTAGFWALLAKGVAQMVRDVHAIRARMEK